MGVYRFRYISENGWVNGEAVSRFAAGEGMYEASPGIDIFRSPGQLIAGYSPSSLSGIDTGNIITEFKSAVVGDSTPIRAILGYSDAGKLYRINQSTDAVATLNTATNPRDGLEVHKDYAYYARSTNIGRYGALSAAVPAADDTYVASLTSTVKGNNVPHPLHSYKGYLYIGDANVLKRVLGSESTGTSGSTALTFDVDMIITALNDNGPLLFIGATQEPNNSNAIYKSKAVLYAWNGTDRAFTDAYTFPESYINRIDIVEDKVYVIGVNNVYQLIGTNFKVISALGASGVVGPGGSTFAYGRLWWKDNNTIRAYGTPDLSLPTVKYTPFTGVGTARGAVIWSTATKCYVADNGVVYKLDSGYSTASFNSRFIHLGQKETIEEVRIYGSANLASGDEVAILIYDEVNTAVTVATYSYANLGAVSNWSYHANNFSTGAPVLTGFKLGLSFTGSSTAAIREVVVVTKALVQP